MNWHFRIIVLNILVILHLSSYSQIIQVSSTENKKWDKHSVEKWKIFKKDTPITLEVKSDNNDQIIDGFGGCFNEMGWAALECLSESNRKEVLNSLFSTNGCGFSICRMPLGANDYSLDWYSYNETSEDFNMVNFSIDHDRKYLIPYIKAAQKISPDIKIWASPWCPPSWMKTNKHYACWAAKENDLSPSLNGDEMVTQFIMEPKYLKAYALYFEKFINSYKKEGIKISAIHPQNELNSCQKFPSCIWRPEDIAQFIGTYLGPQLKKSNPEIDIWLGTIERPHHERLDTILKNPKVKPYIKGVGFQWAGKDAIGYVKQTYPELKLMQTETECGDGSNDWAAAEYTFDLMKHYLNSGANAYMYWNMVLEEKGISRWGWKQNSMISINTKSLAITYNPEFYLMKHLTHYVKPGAKKLKQDLNYPNAISFLNADGSTVILIFNKEDKASTINIKINDKVISTTLEKRSINTIVIPH